MPELFDPFALRGLTLRNRVGVSPMCQYSAHDGEVNDWHLVHLGSRAVGGAGLIIAEATAVQAAGRITPEDAGLWRDGHIEPWARVTRFVIQMGAAPGIQLAHAGRKASTLRPWAPNRQRGTLTTEQGGWPIVGPSAVPFTDGYATPRELSASELRELVHDFAAAARRAVLAGFQLVEVHAAHGYLLHSFLSPLTNRRADDFGGSFAGRTRLLLEVTRAVRASIPEAMPLSVRLSCVDGVKDVEGVEAGWTLDDSVALAKLLRDEGVDIIDCSSGGATATGQTVKSPQQPLFQVPFAERIKRESGVATAAVGLIRTPQEAAEIVRSGRADMVLLAREMLREPYWAVSAAQALGTPKGAPWPAQIDYWVGASA